VKAVSSASTIARSAHLPILYMTSLQTQRKFATRSNFVSDDSACSQHQTVSMSLFVHAYSNVLPFCVNKDAGECQMTHTVSKAETTPLSMHCIWNLYIQFLIANDCYANFKFKSQVTDVTI